MKVIQCLTFNSVRMVASDLSLGDVNFRPQACPEVVSACLGGTCAHPWLPILFFRYTDAGIITPTSRDQPDSRYHRLLDTRTKILRPPWGSGTQADKFQPYFRMSSTLIGGVNENRFLMQWSCYSGMVCKAAIFSSCTHQGSARFSLLLSSM